jgi:hypothetical protein
VNRGQFEQLLLSRQMSAHISIRARGIAFFVRQLSTHRPPPEEASVVHLPTLQRIAHSPTDQQIDAPAMLPSSTRDRAALEAYADSILTGGPRAMAMVSSFANAQLPGGLSPVMLASRHSSPEKAVKIIDLLVTHGADLSTRDDRGRQALMYACEYGADVAVVECLLAWNKRRGKWALQWADRDCEGRDALVLAARAGHGKLAAQLLQLVDLERFPLENYPLAVLEAAIESNKEDSATSVLENNKIRRELTANGSTSTQTKHAWQRTCSLTTCVEAAVRAGMNHVVGEMLQMNAAGVRRATWYAVYKTSKQTEVGVGATFKIRDEFHRIAATYQRERVWDQVKTIAPLRRCSVLREKEAQLSMWERVRRRLTYGQREWDALEQHPFATLSGDVFASIVGFVGPSEEEDARQIRLEDEARRCGACSGMCIPGECHRQHLVNADDEVLEML